jgi:hypothetical protein
MKNFNLYKKRNGQSWKYEGQYFCANFEEAKKEFSRNCWNDLLEGKHGDNYVHLEPASDGVKESGIYYLNGQPNEELDCFFSIENLDAGIEFFSEDVYSWEIRNLFIFEITDTEGDTSKEEFENLDQAKEVFPEIDGYKIKQVD